jgi:hypothetical protein
MSPIAEVEVMAHAHHEYGQIRMTGRVGIQVSLLLSRPCRKTLLEHAATVTSV